MAGAGIRKAHRHALRVRIDLGRRGPHPRRVDRGLPHFVRRRSPTSRGTPTGIDDVAEVVDSASGLEALEKASPDLVILDLNLPGESGLALLPRLKERAPEVVVVVFTNHSGPQYAARCRELGADGFLDKSKDFPRLAAMLERLG
jgi:DNA-binding NarL/FixJ family response regulator